MHFLTTHQLSLKILITILILLKGDLSDAIINSMDVDNTYEIRRHRLFNTLKKRFFTKSIKSCIGWTENEDKASDIITKLRLQVTTQPGYYDSPWERHPFLSVHSQIVNTQLYKVLQQMPKGGILHLHSDSMGDYSSLLTLAALYKDVDQFYVSTTSSGSPDEYFKLSSVPIDQYLPLSMVLTDTELWKRVLGDLTLTVDKLKCGGDMWRFFSPIFARVTTLLSVTSIAYQYYTKAFQYLLKEEHICHVELRTPWYVENSTIIGTKENTILSALTNANKTSMGMQLSMRVIFIDSRHHASTEDDINKIHNNITYVAKTMMKPDQLSKYLVGYDLVSEEDTGQTTHYCVPTIMESLLISGDKIYPTFYLHDGETNLPSGHGTQADQVPAQSSTNDNLIDAYLINTIRRDKSTISVGRVGHALGLYKDTGLMERYRSQSIAIELCPISNQLLQYVGDLRNHPGQLYLSMGLPCSLNPDDPAIYGYQGVTFDFWEACVAWNLDLMALKVLAYNSLQYSSLPEKEKEDKINAWLHDWYLFIDELISH